MPRTAPIISGGEEDVPHRNHVVSRSMAGW